MVLVAAPNTFNELNQVVLRGQPLRVVLYQQGHNADSLELHLCAVRLRQRGGGATV